MTQVFQPVKLEGYNHQHKRVPRKGSDSDRRCPEAKTQMYIFSFPEIWGSVCVLNLRQHMTLNTEINPLLTKSIFL